MKDQERIEQLSERAWAFRRQCGFLKMLPAEIRAEAAEIASAGASVPLLAKALGVSKNTIREWTQKYAPKSADFSEVQVVENRGQFEVRLSAAVQGCRVELTGSDFSLLQRLLHKLGG